MRKVVCAGAGVAILIAAASPAFAAACAGPAGFGAWLQGFKKEAVAQGISVVLLLIQQFTPIGDTDGGE